MMKLHPVLLEAAQVRTETGTCIGLAKVQQGEQFILDGRTPEGNGMCTNALCALSNAAFIMMSTEKKLNEKGGAIERVCPHGVVTFRISRTEKGKLTPFCEK